VRSGKDATAWRRLDWTRPVATDTETTGLRTSAGHRPFIFAAADAAWRTAVASFPVDPFTRQVQYAARPVLYSAVRRSLESAPRLVYHHAKFDIQMYRAAGVRVSAAFARFEDTLYAAHHCNSLEPSLGLKKLAKLYGGVPDTDEKELQAAVVWCRREGKKLGWSLGVERGYTIHGPKTTAVLQTDYWLPAAIALHHPAIAKKWSGTPLDRVAEVYAVRDVERTQLLWQFYDDLIDALGVRGAYVDEKDLLKVTLRMEARGCAVRRADVKEEMERLRVKSEVHLRKMRVMSGNPDLDPDRTVQIRKYLFDERKLEVKFRTPTGLPQANIAALRAYDTDPFVRELFGYRAAEKGFGFQAGYLTTMARDQLGGAVLERHRYGWCCHPDFQQIGPATGRYSCRKPNLQNVPDAFTTRSIEPIQARFPFGPRPGFWWVHYDYSQLEIRVFAHFAQEQGMLDVLLSGRDLHAECSELIWGGKGNDKALVQACHSLDLVQDKPQSEEVAVLWRKYKWRPEWKTDQKRMFRVAEDWLHSFGYQIIVAEASIGRQKARSKAKMVFFGKIFGGGPNVLVDFAGYTWEDAKQTYADYSATFPGIDRFIKRISKQGKRDGYITASYGRRLAIDPDFAYRAANYIVQGSSAALLKNRTRAMAEHIQRSAVCRGGGPLLTIHDEFVAELPVTVTGDELRTQKAIMEDHGGEFCLPLPASVYIATERWSERRKVDLKTLPAGRIDPATFKKETEK